MDDDDMIVVVVGDVDKVEFTGEPEKICASIPIKEEPLYEYDVMEIIATAERYGRPIKLEIDEETQDTDITFENVIQNIKEEMSSMNEEDNAESYTNYQIATDSGSDSSVESDSRSVKDNPHRNRRKMLSPSRRESFIEDLRQQYPELKNNQKALINYIVEIMRKYKPPSPPKDFFVVNDIMYECVKCRAITNCIPAATRHYQEKHGPRYLVCFACGVDFRCKTNLYKHEKRCQAPDADIVLKARAMFLGRKGRGRPFIPDLPDHKRFSCYECSATFTTKENLIAHENMHNGVRPYCCDQCPRAYTSTSALMRHLKTHTDKQYICDHCKRSFKIRTSLVAHMDTHKAVPKHACSVCPQRYATKNALNHHVRRVHLHLPMPCACQVCPKRYPRMSLLRDHMKKKHGMSLMTRKMFFKALPTMTESQLQQAKAILKAEGPLVNLSANINGWVQS